MLRHFISIRFKNTNISKIFNVGRNLIARCIKFHGLKDTNREPEDNDEITEMLREFRKFNNFFGYSYAVGHLHTNGIKFKQARFRMILKISKTPRSFP